MKHINFFIALCCVFSLALLAFGCNPITTVYKVAVDERSVQQIVSDKKIATTIQAKFAKDDTIKVLDISVYCYNGLVYLVGQKETDAEEERAVGLAKNMDGVKSVTKYILWKKEDKEKESCTTKDSLEITAKAKAKLIKDKDIWSTNVDVKTVQCNVVLVGIVGSREEIENSIAHAKSVEGVLSVKSFLVPVKSIE